MALYAYPHHPYFPYDPASDPTVLEARRAQRTARQLVYLAGCAEQAAGATVESAVESANYAAAYWNWYNSTCNSCPAYHTSYPPPQYLPAMAPQALPAPPPEALRPRKHPPQDQSSVYAMSEVVIPWVPEKRGFVRRALNWLKRAVL